MRPATQQSGDGSGRHHPLVLVAVAAAAGVVAAVFVAIVTWSWTYESAMSDCTTSTDDWCELSAGLGAIMSAIFAGVLVYLAVGWTIILRCRPAGQRLGYVFGHLAAAAGLLPLTLTAFTILT